jgi:heme/copper-type cytochrome/quinol oxidase subunit 2
MLFAAGIGLAYLVARVWAPHWPQFCRDITVAEPCAAVATQTMTGYLVIALGVAVMILGPVAGALLELMIHGHRWETPRGPETVVTNIPIVLGAVYLVLGGVLAATA